MYAAKHISLPGNTSQGKNSPTTFFQSFQTYKHELINKIKDPEQAIANNFKLIRCEATKTIAIDPVIAPDKRLYSLRFLLHWLKANSVSPATKEPMMLIREKNRQYLRYRGHNFSDIVNEVVYNTIKFYARTNKDIQKELTSLYSIDDYIKAFTRLADQNAVLEFYEGRRLNKKQCLLEAIDLAQKDKSGEYTNPKKAFPYLELAQLVEGNEVIMLKNGSIATRVSLLQNANELDPGNIKIAKYLADSVFVASDLLRFSGV